MFEVVVNKSYGGFGLSDAAMRLYAEKKGFEIWERNRHHYTEFYKVPLEVYDELQEQLRGVHWNEKMEEKKRLNDMIFSDRYIERDDPVLVEVVKELGEDANDSYSDLGIVELPDDVKGNWHIEEYDGAETIRENHRVW